MPTIKYRIFLNLEGDRVVFGDSFDSIEELLRYYNWIAELLDEEMLDHLKKELASEDYDMMDFCIFMQKPESNVESIYYGVEVEGAKQLSMPGVWYLAIDKFED